MLSSKIYLRLLTKCGMMVSFSSSKAMVSPALYFLGYLQQRVVLNEKRSNWSPVTADVPQGSVLGPLVFLICVNDLVDNVKSEAKIFADELLPIS